MPKKTYHHGDLRQSLIEAALVLLKTKDIKSLSLREVARQAGVSHTAPYRHFADKADLLAAVAEEGFVEFGRYLQDAVEQANAEPIKSLQATGIAYVRYALDHPTHFRVMFSHCPSEPAEDSRLETVSQGTFQILVDIIKAGQATTTIKAGDPSVLALEKWALVHGLAMLMLDGMLPAEGEAAIALASTVVANNITSALMPPKAALLSQSTIATSGG